MTINTEFDFGKTVYLLTKEGRILEGVVSELQVTLNGVKRITVRRDYGFVMYNDIIGVEQMGKDAFLSREEAEERLKSGRKTA